MVNLPQRKVGLVACSGEELPEGTVTRLAALKVLEELRPADTVTICLPLFLAGGEGDRAFAKFYPTIAIDGCDKRCAARATELYSNTPAASLLVDDIIAAEGLPRPKGMRRLASEAAPLVDALAEAIATEVDHLMSVRWSRSKGVMLETETAAQPAATGATCSCGSGIPMTSVQVNGHTVQLMALDAIFGLAYGQGMRIIVDDQSPPAAPPPQLWETVKLYNPIPAGDESLYSAAVAQAWQIYCAAQETNHG